MVVPPCSATWKHEPLCIRHIIFLSFAMLRQVAFWGASAAAFGTGVYAAVSYTNSGKRAEQEKLYNQSGTTPREDARAIFDKWASSYDSKVSMDERIFLISRLRKKLVSQARGEVLEVGAGAIDVQTSILTFNLVLLGGVTRMPF
jgi:hypothetical protein